MCETFEEIFKRVQFKELAISKCSLGEEATVSIFDMLEYYESANKLKINMTVDLTGRGGDAFQRYIAKVTTLIYLRMLFLCVLTNLL